MANKRISQLPYVGNTGYTTSDIMPIVNYDVPTGTTKHTPIIDFKNWVLSATPVSYITLVSLISNSELIQGSFYLINNFRTCYDQPDFNFDGTPITTGIYKQGSIDPIMVLATSNNTISTTAYQPSYPNDKIEYDWTWNLTEVTNGTAYGRITERVDEFNNRTDYDHRTILFKRYRLFTFRPDQPLNGTVELLNDGTINGTNTYFTLLNVGDVVYIPSTNPSYYEIISINNDLTMIVSGDTITSVGSGQQIFLTIEETNGSGYFSYKKTNVKSNDFTEYTTFGDAILNDYAKNNYIGNLSNNYQNVGSNTFILSNNVFLEGQYESNKFGDYCYNNTFGTDNQNNVWGDYCYENVSTNDIDDNIIGHYFNNNLINVNLTSNQIGSYFSGNYLLAENSDDFDRNLIGNNFQKNLIYSRFYNNQILNEFNGNVIGDFGNLTQFEFYRNYISNNFNSNTIRQTFQNNRIGTNFQTNNINGEFVGNTILNGFNKNIVGSYFSLNNIGNGFNNNNVSDSFNQNKTDYYFNSNMVSTDFNTNEIGAYFRNNRPSNSELFGWSDLSTVSTRSYDIFNNVVGGGGIGNKILGKELVMRVISTSQYFKIKILQWTQGSNGGGFSYERQEIDSAGNIIGSNILFTKRNYVNDIDVIIPGVLEIARGSNNGIYNIVSEGSYNGSISPADTEWNSIYVEPNNGKRFAYNKIGNNFSDNIINNDFGYGGSSQQGNIINDNFEQNNIGQFMYNNVIGNYFTNNTIDNNFENNTIKNFFNSNLIGSSFENNEIGEYFGNDKRSNVIGKNFQNNKIGNFFGYYASDNGGNLINDFFTNNEIKNHFINNVIESYFENNTIGNYFGSEKTKNIIGGYFRNNKIGNFFGNDGNLNGGNLVGVTNTLTYTLLSGIPSGVTLTNGGSGYVDSTNVATTGGGGSSLTVDILTDGLGVVTAVTINTPGTYYSVGDSITISAGGNDATFNITGISSFVVGDVIDNGFGQTAEIVTDDGIGTSTINVMIGGLISGTIDNNAGVTANVINVETTPYVSGLTQNNVIGDYFLNNQIGNNFQNNQIGNYFGNDISTDMSNIILDNFESNIIGNYFGIDVETPSIGEGGNIIRNKFIGNTIGDSFTYNITYDTSGGGYNNNTIGWGCNTNTFGDGFNYNRIGDLFQENLLGVYFAGNEIGYFFNLNQINDNAGFNRIGEISWFNQIDTGFEANRTGVSFFGNTIGINFTHNTIGNYFGQFFVAGNIFGDDIYDNRFGDHTYGNQVGLSFNNNNIFNNFINNIVGDDFKYNITQYDVNGIDFSSATHVYNNYNCTIFNDSTSTLKLSYIDGTPSLVVVTPNS